MNINFRKIFKIIKNLVIGLLIIILLYSVAKAFIPTTLHVAKGNGMAPTIHKGDIFRVDKRIKSFKRGDIVLYKIPFQGTYYQRIIGVPSDKIEIKRNKNGIAEVYINNNIIDEPYKINKQEFSPHPKAVHNGPTVVKEYHYFVLGDDRDLSFDSRFFGALHKWFIVGKVTEIRK